MARGSTKADPKTIASRVNKKIHSASELPQTFRGLVYGRSGHQKTRLVSTLPDVLLIDVNERGTDSVRRDYDPQVYSVEYWNDLNDVFWWLQEGDHSFKSVAIDGVTAMQNLCMKFVLGDEASRDASRDPDMPSRQIYGKVNELMKTQILNFRNLPYNIMFTALERKKFIGEDEGEEGGEVTVGPECSPGVSKILEQAVGMIGRISTTTISRKVEGRKKPRRIVRTRLLIGSSEIYSTKDRYGLNVPYIDQPNMVRILDQIFGHKES